jgi:hypothetical protein
MTIYRIESSAQLHRLNHRSAHAFGHTGPSYVYKMIHVLDYYLARDVSISEYFMRVKIQYVK